MKLRLKRTSLTDEDLEIWWDRVHWGEDLHVIGQLGIHSIESDRLDADRMLRIMQLGCRFCGATSIYGEAHQRDCIYVTDPSTRQVWIRQGARIIE